MRSRIPRVWILAMVCVVVAGAAAAVPPNDVTYQGRLLDPSGNPLAGPVDVEIGVWNQAVGGTRLYGETHSGVVLADGVFSILLGTGTVLAGSFDANLFAAQNRYLEVTVQGELLQPRQAFSSVAYALRAAVADSGPDLPPGAVMHFDLPSCPIGWSDLSAASGRALVGLPAGGTAGGTVGAPLGNLEDRTHDHPVLPPSQPTTTFSNPHNHSFGPLSTTSASTPVPHSHSIGAFSTELSPVHSHLWSRWNGSGKNWSSFDASGSSFLVANWSAGGVTAGFGTAPFSVGFTEPSNDFYTQGGGQHTHTVNSPGFTGGSPGASHTHAVDIPAAVSQGAGSHNHTVQISQPFPSGDASTSSVLPYLQLRVCRKD